MGNQLLLFTFSFILFLSAFAQEESADSIASSTVDLVTVEASEQELSTDTSAYKRTFIPSIYIDYGKLLTLPSSQETKYEGGIELLFQEKFPLIVEVGSATLNPDQAFSNGSYESSGMYFRIGTGIYSQFTPKNKLGFTIRYGSSTFDETIRTVIESPTGIQDTEIESDDRPNLSASWFEAVIYSDRKINDLLTIGINIRLRILQNYDEQSPVDVYAIPGYGRSFDNSIPAANLFLKASF